MSVRPTICNAAMAGETLSLSVAPLFRHGEAGMELTRIGYALANDLSGIVDRESSGQVHKRPRIADETIEVRRLGAFPYEGAPEVRIVRLDAKADDLASIIGGVAAADHRRDRPGKGAVV